MKFNVNVEVKSILPFSNREPRPRACHSRSQPTASALLPRQWRRASSRAKQRVSSSLSTYALTSATCASSSFRLFTRSLPLPMPSAIFSRSSASISFQCTVTKQERHLQPLFKVSELTAHDGCIHLPHDVEDILTLSGTFPSVFSSPFPVIGPQQNIK